MVGMFGIEGMFGKEFIEGNGGRVTCGTDGMVGIEGRLGMFVGNGGTLFG